MAAEVFFSISEQEASDSIGSDFYKLRNLGRILRGTHQLLGDKSTQSEDADSLSFRLAPSIVSRSEAELFGTSSPRFAVRAYLDPTRESFVNARRMNEFAARVKGRPWAKLSPPIIRLDTGTYIDVSDPPNNQPHEAMLANKCIGDSVLKSRKELRDAYHILEAELGTPYGEGKEIWATPFLNPISCPGGGLCAQACCFMASALLHDYPILNHKHVSEVPDLSDGPKYFTGIHGVAEITAIVAGDGPRELRLKGLSWAHITVYFDRVGRIASSQRMQRQRSQASTADFFPAALRGYLMSGFPVIVPVNYPEMQNWQGRLGDVQGRAPDKQTAANESLQIKPAVPTENNEDHAIVLVGCGKTAQEKFLFNDPANTPFRETDLNGLVTYCICGTKTRLQPLFLPVTPSEIRLTLETRYLPTHGNKDRVEIPGLFDIAHLLQRKNKRWTDARYPMLDQTMAYDPGTFQLVRIYADFPGRTRIRPLAPEPAQILPSEVLEAQDFRKAWVTLRPWNDRWCWIQYKVGQKPGHYHVWIWDAQTEHHIRRWWTNEHDSSEVFDDEVKGEVFEKAQAILVAVFSKNSSEWKVTYQSPLEPQALSVSPPGDTSDSREKASMATLKSALISSFSPAGSHDAVTHWPQGLTQGAELYAFMHMDAHLHHWNGANQEPGHSAKWGSALEFMATAGDEIAKFPKQADEKLRRLASGMAHSFSNCSPIVALASYLPELAVEDPEEKAVSAVSFLVHFARALRAVQLDEQGLIQHPVSVIELVAGSRIRGVSQTCEDTKLGIEHKKRTDYTYFAQRVSTAEAIHDLCVNLKKVIDRTKLLPDEGIHFALELEPGPLYALNDLESMELALHYIDHHELTQFVGFNLDIAHFALAGIIPDQLRDPSRSDLLSRVVHSHISDHGQGHFGDLAIGEAGFGQCTECSERLQQFHKWIELLRFLASRKSETRTLPYSGYVSVELEAARSSKPVHESLTRLGELFT